jgi:hypothetical protein
MNTTAPEQRGDEREARPRPHFTSLHVADDVARQTLSLHLPTSTQTVPLL